MATRIAVVEQHRFHEETLFAYAQAAQSIVGAPAITIYARDHRGSRSFLTEVLGVDCEWKDFDDFGRPERPGATSPHYDLVILNTLLPPQTDAALDTAIRIGRRTLAVVHDVSIFERGRVVSQVLTRSGTVRLAFPGLLTPHGMASLAGAQRRRIVQLVPVFRPPDQRDDGHRPDEHVLVLPGTIEYSRRDYDGMLDVVARSRHRMSVIGRSHDLHHGPRIARNLTHERERLVRAVAERRLSDRVLIRTDPPCRDYFDEIARASAVCIVPADPAYFAGKLSGAITAALSCGRAMLAPSGVAAHYERADPRLAGCFLPLETSTEVWPPPDLEAAQARSREVRDAIIDANTVTLARLVGRAGRAGRGAVQGRGP